MNLCNVFPYSSVTKGELGEELVDFEEQKKAGAIAFSDDGIPVVNSRIMREGIIKADKLIENFPQFEGQEGQQNFDWKIDFYNADIKLDDLEMTYYINKALIEANFRDYLFVFNINSRFDTIIYRFFYRYYKYNSK